MMKKAEIVIEINQWLAEARAQQENGNTAEALRQYLRVLQAGYKEWSVFYNIGILYYGMGKTQETVEYCCQSLRIQPDPNGIYMLLCRVLYDRNDFAEVEVWSRFLLLNGFQDAVVYMNLGTALWLQNKVEESIEILQQAQQVTEHKHLFSFNLSQVLLLAGRWIEGFPLFESRFAHKVYEQQQKWYASILSGKDLWQGQLFTGKKLLVHHDMGFGDMLQFVRYVPQVKARGGIVILAVKQPLFSLLQFFPGADQVIVVEEKTLIELDFDLYIPAMSLPLIFGTTPNTIPSVTSYLSAPLARPDDEWRQYMTNEVLKVGIVWASDDKAKLNGPRSRTVGKNAISPLLDVEGVAFYSLQFGSRQEQDNRYVDLAPYLGTFSDTAAIVNQLDLVITVDTAVAHLAGAMGKAVWVMLPFSPDWRWMLEREDTPWYPSMRLFRQTAPGDWQGVIGRVICALQDQVK